MLKRALWIAPVALLGLAGCSGTMDGGSSSKASRAPAAKVVGDPQSCIPISQIRGSKVRDDFTIDFDMAGSKTYRNTLPHSCPGLGSEQAFTYETSLTQLCNTDIIYVLRRIGGDYQRGAGCGLGSFVPVEIVKKGG
jgi:hypothetical protein